MIFYVIPARRDSKGLRHKNRHLFEKTADKIPPEISGHVIVSTDDSEILFKAEEYKYNLIDRDRSLATDQGSIKPVLMDVVNKLYITKNDILVMLYLTYPERTWQDIQNAIMFFQKNGCKSLLCKQDVKSNPFLCMYELDNNRGEQIIKHDLYRRQDYRMVFELSHYIFICLVSELPKLNLNLYNDDTTFMHINNVIDIDTEKDLLKYENCLDNSIR